MIDDRIDAIYLAILSVHHKRYITKVCIMFCYVSVCFDNLSNEQQTKPEDESHSIANRIRRFVTPKKLGIILWPFMRKNTDNHMKCECKELIVLTYFDGRQSLIVELLLLQFYSSKQLSSDAECKINCFTIANGACQSKTKNTQLISFIAKIVDKTWTIHSLECSRC